MGFMYSDDPIAKGPVTYCLDALSVNAINPTFYLSELRTALFNWAQAPGGVNLADVLDRYLFKPVYTTDASKRTAAVSYLKASWFGTAGTYFGDIGKVYASGLVTTLDLSLKDGGNPRPTPLPIDSYWIVDHKEAEGTVELINLLSNYQVTLLIATPRPKGFSSTIFSETSKAWTTVNDSTGTPVTRPIKVKSLAP
jgi:hypothetical protein